MRKLIFLIFLLLAAGWDLVKKEIPLWVYGFGLLLILPLYIYEGIVLSREFSAGQLLAGMGIGAALLLLSLVSREAVGKGDGAFFLVSGLYLNNRENAYLFFFGLLLCSLYCLFLGVWGFLHHKKMWSQTIPFLPFLVPVWIWMILGSGGVL